MHKLRDYVLIDGVLVHWHTLTYLYVICCTGFTYDITLCFQNQCQVFLWLSRGAFSISIPIPRTLRRLHKYGNE